MSIYSRFISSDLAFYLRSFDHWVNPAKFYIVPKVHKDPMIRRPIAAFHSCITGPISIFVDKSIKPTIHLSTVLRDSGKLIRLSCPA